jgi:hydrogenase-4 component E
MTTFADQLLVIVLLLNFVALGTRRAIRAVAAQGITLGLLPSIINEISWHMALISAGMIAIKGLIIPWLLTRATRQADIRQDIEPYLGYTPVLLLGSVATALAFAFANRLPLAPQHQGLLFVPAAVATLLTGSLILISRKKAVNQVAGYLIVENGIFIFGLLLTEAMPVMVEAGVLLDLLVGIFVMGIIINQISREFSSMDTSRMTSLRE